MNVISATSPTKQINAELFSFIDETSTYNF